MKKFLIMLTMAFAIILTACVGEPGKETTESEQKADYELIISQVGEYMVIDSVYGEIKYPYAYSDIINVSMIHTENNTEFLFAVETADFSANSYQVTIGERKDTLIGSLKDGKAVSVQIFGLDGKVNDENKRTFCAVQESVNDVIASIYDWDSFIPEE